MNSYETDLKIQHKLMAEEARLVRREEKKLTKRARTIRKGAPEYTDNILPYLRPVEEERESLHNYRTGELRRDARILNLVRGFVKGRSYLEIENSTKSSVETMIDIAEDMSYYPVNADAVDIVRWMGLPLNEDLQEDERGDTGRTQGLVATLKRMAASVV